MQNYTGINSVEQVSNRMWVLTMKRINSLKVVILLICFAVLALQTVQAKDIPAELKDENVNIGDIFKNLSSYEGVVYFLN